MRPRLVGLLAASVILATPGMSSAQMTTLEYRALPEGERTQYVVGVFDGWLHAWDLMIRAGQGTLADETFGKLIECARPMSRGQVRAIMDKYIQSVPTDLAKGARFDFYAAMSRACRR